MNFLKQAKQKVADFWEAGKIQMGISIVSIVIVLILWIMAVIKIIEVF